MEPSTPVAAGTRPTAPGTGLVRVTVVAPGRRLDVVLPEQAALGELLPGLVERGGDGLHDDGEAHGGWRLRCASGVLLEPARSLAAQGVRDGQCLYLVPGDVEWPEVDYDDVVDAIAQGSRERARDWTPAATRRSGLVGAAVLLVGALVGVLTSGVSPAASGAVITAVGVVLAVGAVVLARPLRDRRGAGALGVLGLVHLALGAAVISSPAPTPWWQLDRTDLLLGSTALLIGSAALHVGVAGAARVFVAGSVLGVAGVLAGALGSVGVDPVGCAAVVVTLATATTTAYPLLAMRMGGIPLPALPQGPEELLADPPRPDAGAVRSAVVRADELLTGLLGGTAVVITVGQVALVHAGTTTATLLALVVGAALALRAALFPTVRHRAPLLAVGAAGLLTTVTPLVRAADTPTGVLVVVVGVLAAAALVLALGTVHSTRRVSPYLGRYADALEVVLVVSVLPLAAAVLGAYGFARGLGG